jgi:hypothetical protein
VGLLISDIFFTLLNVRLSFSDAVNGVALKPTVP